MVLIKWKSIEEEDNSSKNKPKYEFEGKPTRSKKMVSIGSIMSLNKLQDKGGRLL